MIGNSVLSSTETGNLDNIKVSNKELKGEKSRCFTTLDPLDIAERLIREVDDVEF